MMFDTQTWWLRSAIDMGTHVLFWLPFSIVCALSSMGKVDFPLGVWASFVSVPPPDSSCRLGGLRHQSSNSATFIALGLLLAMARLPLPNELHEANQWVTVMPSEGICTQSNGDWKTYPYLG